MLLTQLVNKFKLNHCKLLIPQRYVSYVQGQEPEPKIREYFYYIDHEGMVMEFNYIISRNIFIF